MNKFTMVDPSQGDDVYAMMAGQVNDRLGKAVEDIGKKYDEGQERHDDTSVDGPTGHAYRAAEAVEAKKVKATEKRAKDAEEKAISKAREAEIVQQLEEAGLSDDELDEDETDMELKRIREKRMNELKAGHKEKMEDLSKGHGQYREISQDEFLPEVTSSKKVICHFYHKEFMRCKIMDKHLGQLAPQHVEAKFLKIDADKAPFFVGKLAIKVLPTLIMFEDGVATERIQGFEGLTEGMAKGKEDEFPIWRLGVELAKTGVINYSKPPSMDELRKFHLNARSAIREGIADEDDDWSD